MLKSLWVYILATERVQLSIQKVPWKYRPAYTKPLDLPPADQVRLNYKMAELLS